MSGFTKNEVPEAYVLARQFHETYELLAPSFGYETREETKQFNPYTPNGKLMIAVCDSLRRRILDGLSAAPRPPAQEQKRVHYTYDDLVNLLEDVVNELDLSDACLEIHGPMATLPSELVRFVLKQKDDTIAMLRAGFVYVNDPQLPVHSGEED